MQGTGFRNVKPLRDRLWLHIAVEPETGCWLWTGARNEQGYGRVSMPTGVQGGRTDLVHRVTYVEYVGPIPDGQILDHTCHDPQTCVAPCPHTACCNPEHLEPVTQKVNLHRGGGAQADNAAKTHCKFGHEFTPENTRIVPRGRRCKQCEKRRARESYERRKALG